MNRLVLVTLASFSLFSQSLPLDLVLMDAHNCYPYEGKWSDRLDRALRGGFPVGIEQDLAWGVDLATGKGRPVVSHTPKTTGAEPSLREYFFERVRPIVEKALREDNRASWPLIVVHFDFKDNRPELLRAVWELLGEYESWITTAPVTADASVIAPFDVKPLLVMTEDSDAQEAVFFTPLQKGDKLRLFGSAHTAARPSALVAPEELLAAKPTNYRRWWNNSWHIVEEGGQAKAGEWMAADEARLRALVDHAHAMGYWIRFYTLDGFAPEDDKGWGRGYNFGSREAVLARWKAAIAAGVNLIATDQYEDVARLVPRR